MIGIATAKIFKQFKEPKRMPMKKNDIVTINVGKKGITENLIKEINMVLEKRGVVKVKMLKNFRAIGAMQGKDKKMLAEEIASKVNGKLVDFRGFVLTFKRC